jgi:hypothetical protein
MTAAATGEWKACWKKWRRRRMARKQTVQAGMRQESKNCKQKPMRAEKQDKNPKWRRRI